MFQESVINFIQSQIDDIISSFNEDGDVQYPFKVTMNNNFRCLDSETIQANAIFGGQAKIEGSPNTIYQKFNATIYAEMNTNGLYTQKIFSIFFNAFSKKSIKLIDGTDEYSVFFDFTDLILLDPKAQSGTGYRAKYSFVCTMIFSQSSQIGRHTYFCFPTSTTTDANAVWYEVNTISPSEARDNNLTAKSTSLGIAYLDGNKSFSGNLGLIFENDIVTMKLVKYLHNDTTATINGLWIKYTYQDYEVIEKKLKLQSVEIALDENTKNNVIKITYVKDDVYGI